MGWFDNEQDGENRPAGSAPQPGPPRAAAPRASSTPATSPTPSTSGNTSGSTLGPRIHIDGTIICDEDLTIIGKVDGTIRAKGTLVIASEADVDAKIDGQRVVVHGKVDGDVQGAELVVIGPTGYLTGNIQTPTLEIVEGAHFKGSVDMKTAPPTATASKPQAKASVGEAKPDPAPSAKADEKSKMPPGAPAERSPATHKTGQS